MKTYAKKLQEMRSLSIRIIEKGLENPNPTTQFMNAVMFMSSQPTHELMSEMPEEKDVLDATELMEEGKKDA